MMKQWIKASAVFGCALLVFSTVYIRARAQGQTGEGSHRQTGIVTLEGPAIHILVTEHLPGWDVHKLVTDSRTARDHPDLAAYYRSKAQRLEIEGERDQQMARAFGDRTPMNGDSHFSVGRDAFHYRVAARQCFRQAQNDKLMAALYTQASQGEGCFTCHSFHGRGGKIGPDLAIEGTRGRSNAWLIGHFKDPQAYSPASVMPAFKGLSNRQLEVLATFLQYQKQR